MTTQHRYIPQYKFTRSRRSANHTVLLTTVADIALIVDIPRRLQEGGTSHVNDPLVHLVACVRVLCHVLDVFFIQFVHPGLVPGRFVLVALILHVFVIGVDDGRGEVKKGVLLLLLLAAPDLVLTLDVDKLLARQAQSLEHL